MQGQADKLGLDLSAAKTVDVDVKIGGTMTDPKVSADLKGMANNIVDKLLPRNAHKQNAKKFFKNIREQIKISQITLKS